MRNLETGAPLPEHVAIPKRPYIETLRFLDAAEKAMVPQKVEDNLSDNPRSLKLFQKGYDIAMRYFTTQSFLPEISLDLKMSISQAFESKNEAVKTVWSSSPPVMKKYFPITELTLTKPRDESSNRKISQSKNSHSVPIENALAQGLTIEEIKDIFRLDSRQIQFTRRALGNWGSKLPYLRKGYTVLEKVKEFEDKKNVTDKEKQELLDSVTLGIYMTHHDQNGFLAMLKEVVDKAGYKYVNVHASLYLQELNWMEIPHGEVSYQYKSGLQHGQVRKQRFILRADLDRAVMALKYNPKFDKYKKEDFS